MKTLEKKQEKAKSVFVWAMMFVLLEMVFLTLASGQAKAQSAESDPFKVKREVQLVLLNSARNNPQGYGKRAGLDLEDYTSKPPYKMSKKLNKKATKWAKKMAKHGYGPSNMAYRESIAWSPITNENYTKMYIIDEGVSSLGHRKHMLGYEHNDTKIGIGYAVGEYNGKVGMYNVVITEP